MFHNKKVVEVQSDIVYNDTKKLVEVIDEYKITFSKNDVKDYDEAGLIVVLERVKVSETGVEGSGPVADRVRAIFDRYAKTQAPET